MGGHFRQMAYSLQRSTSRVAAVSIVLAMAVIGTAASAQALRPVRAVYELQLNEARDSAGIEAANGSLVVELIEDCAGYIFNQAFISRISASQGPDILGDMQASVWESRDGRTLRFNLVNRINGKVIEREQGKAGLRDGQGGHAIWQLPQARELTLPKGTVFPISHNREVLARAMAGSRGFEIPLFDGSNEAGYYHAAVFIGERLSGPAKGKLSPTDQPRWPIRLAYFNFKNQLGVPEFEVGYTLYGNGVVDSLTLDYPEFGLLGRLVELDYLDQPDCQ